MCINLYLYLNFKNSYNVYMSFTTANLESTLTFFDWSISVPGISYLKNNMKI